MERPTSNPPRRLVVVGTTGSGKTTMAAQIAARLAIPQIELDALHWGPHWIAVPTEVFRRRVSVALAGPAWVVDGNYQVVLDLVWGTADTVVWLDYALPVILGRLLRRTLRRSLGHHELWSGNRESLRRTFLSRDSILLWALKTYRRRRREIPRLLGEPQYAHLAVVHLSTPRAARAWRDEGRGPRADG